jgi:hypothetical protein
LTGGAATADRNTAAEEEVMDFTLSPKVVQLQKRVLDFMNAHVYPIEKRVEDEMNVHGKEHTEPEILK